MMNAKMTKRSLAAFAAIVAISIPALAQDASLTTDWLELSDAKRSVEMSADGKVQLWSDVLTKIADKYRASNEKIWVGTDQVALKDGQVPPTLFTGIETDAFVLSAGLLQNCDNGANGRTAPKTVHSVCPFRIGFKTNGKVDRVMELPRGCFVWRTILDNPDEDSKSFVKVTDGKIKLKATMEGQPIEDCDFSDLEML